MYYIPRCCNSGGIGLCLQCFLSLCWSKGGLGGLQQINGFLVFNNGRIWRLHIGWMLC